MKRVMLADDSVAARKSIQTVLEMAGIEVVSVGNGDLALARLDGINPDLVLVDVIMPGRSGYEVCAELKSRRTSLPVLLVTSDFEPYDPREAERARADGHLTKPLDSRALSVLREVWDRYQPPNASPPWGHEVAVGGSQAEAPVTFEADGTTISDLDSYATTAMPIPDFSALSPPALPQPAGGTGVVAFNVPIPMPKPFDPDTYDDAASAMPEGAVEHEVLTEVPIPGVALDAPPHRGATTENLDEDIPEELAGVVRDATSAGIRSVSNADLGVARGACPSCGERLTRGDIFCIICGAAVIVTAAEQEALTLRSAQAAACVECGLEIMPGEIFCVGCGAVV